MLTWVRTHGRIQANNGDALLDAAIRGRGITYQPTFIAGDALRAGRVERILEQYPSIELGLFAVFPGGRYVPHRVRALVDFLAARIGDYPEWDRLDEKEAAAKRGPREAGRARDKHRS